MGSEPTGGDPVRLAVWSGVFIAAGLFWLVLGVALWQWLSEDPTAPGQIQEEPPVRAAPCTYHQLDPLKRQLWNCE